MSDAAAVAEHLTVFPVVGGKRIAIVIDVERMNQHGINRLLKTLEEPPPSAQIILTTGSVSSLLETLISRCCLVRAKPPTMDEALRLLQTIDPGVTTDRLRAAGSIGRTV